MRLFIVGSDKVYAIENYYVKYLREQKVEVYHFPAQSLFYDYYQKNLYHKLLYRSGISAILKDINKKFKKEVTDFKPDIIWVFKGMEIFPSSLEFARTRNIKLVNYNGDSPFIFSGKGSGNENVTNSITFYDLFLTYNTADKLQMESQFNIRAEILPFGYDLTGNLFKECCAIQELKKVCFLGNPDTMRCQFVNELAKKGVIIDVYGIGWNDCVSHNNITVYEPVYQDDFWRTLRKYRIQLNLMRPHNLNSHNMRTFEAGGVGAIQLAPDTPDHRAYFKDGEEIFLFNDVETCCQLILRIMDLSDEDAREIRQNARNRSINEGYDYKSRSEQSLKYLEELHH